MKLTCGAGGLTIATNVTPEYKPGVPVASPAGVGLAPYFGRDAQLAKDAYDEVGSTAAGGYVPAPACQRYFILQTHTNAERLARDALQAPYRGCTVYLPLELVTVVHARRRKEVVRAFLPRYLFVLDEGQGGPVMRTAPGVSHVVKCGDQPAMIAQKFIDRIKARESEGMSPDGKRTEFYVDLEWQHDLMQRELYVNGELVRVTDGPFASFDAIFSEWTRRDQRANVLVQIFGRETPVELELSQFEKR